MSTALRFVSLLLPLFAAGLHGQAAAHQVLPVNVRFAATEANAPPGTCGCFFLTGGAADTTLAVLPHTSLAVEVGGNTVDRVMGTSRGLSTITLLAGPRFSLPFRRVSLSAQTLFGAARGFDADFTTGAKVQDTATAFGMALGGFVEVQITRTISLRAAQVDYVQTDLPNGVDNRQRNIRLGAGLTFRVPLPSKRR